MKYALRDAGPFYFAALRTCIAAVCLFALMLVLRRDLRLRAPLPVALLALFQSGLFILLTLCALALGGVGRVSVLNFTMPFWVVLLAWPLLGERERERELQWLAVGTAFAGRIFVAQPWELGDKLATALAVCAGLSWAIGTIIMKRYRTELQRMDAIGLTVWQMLFSALPLVLLAWLVPKPETHWTPHFWASVLYLRILGTALAWLLWTYIITRLPANVASLNTLAIPALAVLFAWLQLGERPNRFEAIGMLLIALGLVQLWWTSRARTAAEVERRGR